MTTAAAALAAYQSDADLRAAKSRLGEALPDSGWLHQYLGAVTPLTDAPVEFHLASGLAAIAGAVGNRMHVQSWGQTVYPHLWTVLVAPSSFWRKSTSINTAEALLRDAVPAASMPSDFSREKLLGLLAEHSSGLLTVKEFGGFLATLGRDYNGGLKESLTELYDGPDLYTRALKSSVIEVRRPALTILGATTLDWLESRITEGDLRGGFLARFLFVTAQQKASAKGLTGGIDPGTRAALVSDLHMLGELEDVASTTYAPGVAAILNDWMHGWEDEVGRTRHRTDLSGFAVRLQTYALKLAMLYRAAAVAGSEPDATAELDELCVRQAIAYCRVLWANVAVLIDEQLAVTDRQREDRRVLQIIGEGAKRTDVLRASKLRAREFDEIVKTLVESRQISAEKRRVSEVGQVGERDTTVTWLEPIHRNGRSRDSLDVSLDVAYMSPLDVPVPLSDIEGTSKPDTSNGPLRAESLSESTYSSPLSSLSVPIENAHGAVRDTRAGAGSRNGSTATDDPMDLL
jgi:hypothetical protein